MHNTSREDLLAILDDIRTRVAAGDSFEGSITYLIPETPGTAHEFDVRAAYRVGNRMGQGGMRLIGIDTTGAGDTDPTDTAELLAVIEDLSRPWQHAANAVAWLDAANGTDAHETAMRLLKVTEEAGEAAAAYLGEQGQNPRKGTTHTGADVAAELSDVILAAMVALHSFTRYPQETFTAHVRAGARRLAQLTGPAAA